MWRTIKMVISLDLKDNIEGRMASWLLFLYSAFFLFSFQFGGNLLAWKHPSPPLLTLYAQNPTDDPKRPAGIFIPQKLPFLWWILIDPYRWITWWSLVVVYHWGGNSVVLFTGWGMDHCAGWCACARVLESNWWLFSGRQGRYLTRDPSRAGGGETHGLGILLHTTPGGWHAGERYLLQECVGLAF